MPPQAYTRETLAKAYQWLQSQPDSVRNVAHSPDSLVGLYLRAQRLGDFNLDNEAPVSSQNFRSDLKNLAEGIRQFDKSKDSPPAPVVSESAFQQVLNPPTQHQSPPHQPSQSPNPPPPVRPSRPAANSNQMDARSQAMVQEVRSELNLSSDQEAVRLLISLGYRQALKSLISQ